jgi:hypothetical protein
VSTSTLGDGSRSSATTAAAAERAASSCCAVAGCELATSFRWAVFMIPLPVVSAAAGAARYSGADTYRKAADYLSCLAASTMAFSVGISFKSGAELLNVRI